MISSRNTLETWERFYMNGKTVTRILELLLKIQPKVLHGLTLLVAVVALALLALRAHPKTSSEPPYNGVRLVEEVLSDSNAKRSPVSFSGGVIDVWLTVSNSPSEFIAIDEQANYDIVKLL